MAQKKARSMAGLVASVVMVKGLKASVQALGSKGFFQLLIFERGAG
jgi:hypothetical protein